MKSRQRLSVTQTQRLALTAGLAASIQVLRADASGLSRYLAEQAAENPHLALSPPVPGEWLPRWSDAFRAAAGAGEDRAESAAPSLIAHVMQAIDAMYPSGPLRRIAVALAEALEASGWLGRPLAEIAAELRVTVAEVERVLVRLQGMEPTGLFARSLSDCLRLQAEEAGLLDAPMRIMLDHLDLLGRRDVGRLARLCAVPEVSILERLRAIRGFDPKPGARFATGAAPLREPDLIATQGEDGWRVALNRSALPTLRLIRPLGRLTDPAARAKWADARALGRMLESRNATLLRVGREILIRQQAALEHGLGALAPLTMAGIAEALEVHESTVSRTVAGTAVDTPRGTWWLRALFSGGMGGEVSAAALRERLARLIGAEDPAAPLSDADLAVALSQDGAEVARRTVAKYRAALHIPAAHQRRMRAAVPQTAGQRRFGG